MSTNDLGHWEKIENQHHRLMTLAGDDGVDSADPDARLSARLQRKLDQLNVIEYNERRAGFRVHSFVVEQINGETFYTFLLIRMTAAEMAFGGIRR